MERAQCASFGLHIVVLTETYLSENNVQSLLGEWQIVATTLNFWRGKYDPRVTYRELGDARWLDTIQWRSKRGSTRSLSGINRLSAGLDAPATTCRFAWRGKGLMTWITSEWRFVALGPEGKWAVTWFSQATLGVTPAGMDVYAREGALPELREVNGSLDEGVRALLNDVPNVPTFEGFYRTLR
jgi:hypothetical protein